jgi:uncharacterized Fe-S cluster-containing radical SAM superfamily protein
LIIAGPGSGKTEVLACRVAYLIRAGIAKPDNILVKAHNGLDFEKITGAKAEGFDYQLLAIERLRKASINCSIAVMAPFVDPNKLPCHVHEIEDLILYKSTEKNLRQRGF